LERTIRTALELDAQVVVTTNDGTVADRATALGVTVLQQPESLAVPNIPLDAPVAWAVGQVQRDGFSPQVVVTLQVTSPFTRLETVRQAIQLVRDFQTSVVTVRDDRGLRWHAPSHDCVLTTRAPYRMVRQQMPPEWRETGAIFATPAAYVTPTSRFTHTAYLLPVVGREALDIDTPEDWALAEWYAGPTVREQLLARVLTSQRLPTDMPFCVFSAYREPIEETVERATEAVRRCPHEVHHVVAEHTYAECRLALECTRGEPNVAIITSAYHQPRAFLTMLKAMEDTKDPRQIWNCPAPSSMAKWPQEVEKIERYQALGQVVSYEDGLAYLEESMVSDGV